MAICGIRRVTEDAVTAGADRVRLQGQRVQIVSGSKDSGCRSCQAPRTEAAVRVRLSARAAHADGVRLQGQQVLILWGCRDSKCRSCETVRTSGADRVRLQGQQVQIV